MRILVVGGTGHLGSAFTDAALKQGHSLRVLGRRAPAASSSYDYVQGDLVSGAGVAAAVRGVDAILHAASDATNGGAMDVAATKCLIDEARKANVGHVLFVSIIGVDRIPLPYYQQKVAAEEVVAGSGVPWTIVRAAQFHYFVDFVLSQAARVPLVLPLPAGFRVQSIGLDDVADALCRAIVSGPSGRVSDLVGPEAMPVSRAARLWLDARRMRRAIIPLPVPGTVAKAFRAHHNTNLARAAGTETWSDWLASRYGPPTAPARDIR